MLKERNQSMAILSSTTPYTTRLPREGETNGVEYHFISKPEFEHMIKTTQFLEYGQFRNNWYGTAKQDVDLNKKLLPSLNPNIDYTSVPFTTRKQRENEENGVDYYFISEAQFFKLREEKYFAEQGSRLGIFYGTAKKGLDIPEFIKNAEEVPLVSSNIIDERDFCYYESQV